MIEPRFAALNITEDEDRYWQVVKNLGIGLVTKMADVLTTLPPGSKYETLKAYLVKKYAESDEEKLERLFRESTLGDRLPSELYTEMKRCGNTQVHPDTILRIWWRRLPDDIAVAIDNEIAQRDAVQAVEKADRLANLRKSSSEAHVGAIASQALASSNASPNDELNVLYARIAALEKRESRSESRDSHSRRRGRSRSRSKSRPPEWVCRLHYKFGADARYCVQPCAYASLIAAGKTPARRRAPEFENTDQKK